MDAKEIDHIRNAARTFGRVLIQNRAMTHVNSVSIHLYPVMCGHDTPHFCVSTDAIDPQSIAEANANIPSVWEGFQVYVMHGTVTRFASENKQTEEKVDSEGV